jgi:hypothetical protein
MPATKGTNARTTGAKRARKTLAAPYWVTNLSLRAMRCGYLFSGQEVRISSLQWKDVVIGALVTSVLFNIGKTLIGWYIGSSAVASSYGAAAGLIVLLLWVYYSVQIFLLGAEFTKIYANRHGSKQGTPVAEGTTSLRTRHGR